jgi:hypothetical protein
LRPTIALIAAVLATHIIEFVGGVRLSPLAIGLFPASLLPILLTLLIVPWLALTLVPLRKPARFLRLLGSIAVAIVLWAICFLALHFPSYLLGFVWQVKRVATPQEIERAALKCLEIQPGGGVIGAPFAFVRAPGDDERWQQLKQFRFLNLGEHDCTIYIDPPRVEFSWGGALIGHTGVRYIRDGTLSRDWDYRLYRWSPNVAFFQSP